MIPWLFAFLALAAAAPSPALAPPKLVASPGGAVLRWGNATSSVMRSGGAPLAAARVETLQAASGGWALVHLPQASGRNKVWAFIEQGQTKLKLAWEGEDGWLDADGEASTKVALAPTGPVRSFFASWLRRCDAAAPIWRVETFDAGGGGFVQSNVPPKQGSDNTALLRAASALPLLQGEPWPSLPERVFAFTAASAATAKTARALPSAGALDDGNVATAWKPFDASGGFAFATARAPTATAVRGLAFTKAQGSRWPPELWVTVSDAQRFEVAVPEDAGATIWLTLPNAVTTSCLTIDVIGGQKAQPLALAEVQVLTGLSGVNAFEQVADDVLSGTNCHGALQTVSHVDAASFAKRLATKLASSSQAGQACAWEAMASLPPTVVPPLQSWLVPSLPSVLGAPPSMLKPQTLALWTERGGAGAWQATLGILRDATQPAYTRETGARVLANNKLAVEVLLDQVGAFEGESKSLVRRALLQSSALPAASIERRLSQAVDAWQKQPEYVSELLWLATRMPRPTAAPQWLQPARACAADTAIVFVLRARCLQALGPYDASAETLLAIAVRDSDPVIRHLAYEALLSKGEISWTPRLEGSLIEGLRDRDPRVRQTVVRAFARVGADSVRRHAAVLQKAYGAERWPFALGAYLEFFARACLGSEALLAAGQRADVPLDGKIVALEGLATCRFPAAREEALNTLKRQAAPVPLREAAAKVLINVGKAEDANTLLRVLRQATSAAAADPSLDDVAGATLDTLVALDRAQATVASLELVGQRRPRLRRSGMAALGKLCGPQATTAIEAHVASSDAWLANAARQAKTHCEARTP